MCSIERHARFPFYWTKKNRTLKYGELSHPWLHDDHELAAMVCMLQAAKMLKKWKWCEWIFNEYNMERKWCAWCALWKRYFYSTGVSIVLSTGTSAEDIKFSGSSWRPESLSYFSWKFWFPSFWWSIFRFRGLYKRNKSLPKTKKTSFFRFRAPY